MAAQPGPRFRFAAREQPIRWPEILRVDVAKLQNLNPVPIAELSLLDETARVVSEFNIVPDTNAPASDELQRFVTFTKVRYEHDPCLRHVPWLQGRTSSRELAKT